MARFNLKDYAKKGAADRVEELRAELIEIYAMFPELRGSVPAAATKAWRKAATRTRRKPMSTAARKAVSARMKNYWSAKRKAKGL
jgi:hypothetical protein